jgi:hypothetical protein
MPTTHQMVVTSHQSILLFHFSQEAFVAFKLIWKTIFESPRHSHSSINATDYFAVYFSLLLVRVVDHEVNISHVRSFRFTMNSCFT